MCGDVESARIAFLEAAKFADLSFFVTQKFCFAEHPIFASKPHSMRQIASHKAHVSKRQLPSTTRLSK